MEAAAAMRLALDPDVAAHQRDELCRNRESQPRAAVPARRRPVRLCERLEDRVLLLPGDADAGIDDAEPEADEVR